MVWDAWQRYRPILLPLLVAIPLLCAVSPAGCVTLTATQATYTHWSLPNHSYADEIDLHIEHNAGQSCDRNIFLQFDLGSIPSTAVITQATLRLYQYDSSSMDDEDWLIVGAYRLIKSWAEGIGGTNDGACWNYRDAGTANPWSGGGARYVAGSLADRHYANIGGWVGVPDDIETCTYVPTGGPGRWEDWDVTPSTQFWHNNPSKNYGLVLDKWVEGSYSYDGNEWVYFWSEDYGDDNYRPKLDVTYYTPGSQTPITLSFGSLNLNYFNGDPQITFSNDAGRLKCQGTTSNTTWDGDGSLTTFTTNTGFECDVKVKLEDGICGTDDGNYAFLMWENSGKYIQLAAIGGTLEYYEISGVCAATGNGERHDGSAYWSSYWDAGYPGGPTTGSVLFLSETPSSEPSTYLTWKIRYDKTNQVFCAYVTDGVFSRRVTYYTGVNFSNWKIALVHSSNISGMLTTVYTRFPDSNPPTPNPMTWATAPYAVSTSEIAMIATTASDETPPIEYYFHETTGNPGGSSYGWTQDEEYADTGLSANTRYGYEVKARDSSEAQNETAYSTIGYAYTLMPTPTGCSTSNVTATTVDLSANGSFPNLTQGQSGVRFNSPTPGGNGGIDTWIQTTTDQATGLTPNTQYTFRVKARNGDAIETDWGATQPTVRTLAAQPTAMPYAPIGNTAFQANWGANNNPPGTEYYCEEAVTGRSSGWITATNWIVKGLDPNTTYRARVKARNAEGRETGWTDLGDVVTSTPIGQIKREAPPGTSVQLINKMVTAVFELERLAWVQDGPIPGIREGVAGIAVKLPEGSPVLIREGDYVDVDGILQLNDPPYDQELIVTAESVRPMGHSIPLEPLGGSNKAMGGGDFGSQPGVWDKVGDDPVPSFGLNVVGTLVKLWGTLLEDPQGTPGIVYIEDGSYLWDGNQMGVRVDLGPAGIVPPPIVRPYIAITGVMRCRLIDPPGLNFRVVWPRTSDDFVVYP